MVIFGGIETSKVKYSSDLYTLDTSTLNWSREETSGSLIRKKEYRTAVMHGNNIRTGVNFKLIIFDYKHIFMFSLG